MLNQDLQHIRQDYIAEPLEELEMAANPIIQLELWMETALNTPSILNPTAATLATVSPNGMPQARIILIKEINNTGLTFYTNYNSQKGQDLNYCSQACINFYWEPLHQQVRINGNINKVDTETTQNYFNSRPKDSQAAAVSSNQSYPVSKETLLAQFDTILQQETISCPSHWGGYKLSPSQFEFWQGQPNRLHDRVQYHQQDNQWKKSRVSP